MAATVKLLGPDLPNPLMVEVEVGDTILNLKEKMLAVWPSGALSLLNSKLRTRPRPVL